METAQKERQLYPPLLLSRASQVQSPLITPHCAAVNARVATDQELVWRLQGEDGKLEQELQHYKDLTLFPSTWCRIGQPAKPNLEWWGRFPDKPGEGDNG